MSNWSWARGADGACARAGAVIAASIATIESALQAAARDDALVISLLERTEHADGGRTSHELLQH